MKQQGIILGGPTGVGKTSLSLQLAKEYGAEIISADSAQVYKGMDIGTAKIKEEEKEGIVHHGLDLVEPREKYSVGDYAKEVNALLKEKYEKEENVLLVGGTGLYLGAISEGFSNLPGADAKLRAIFATQSLEDLVEELRSKDPISAASVDCKNRVRVERALEVFYLTGKSFAIISKENHKENPYDFACFALEREREHLYERINRRVDIMMEEGLLEEVEGLYKVYGEAIKNLRVIGYSQIIDYLNKEVSLDYAVERIKRDSRHYAKRQFTWFKNKKEYIWYNLDQKTEEEILEEMKNFLIKK